MALRKEAATDRLPNAERAYVPEEKIVRYLLSEESPRGRTKAAFLRRFGFDREGWRVLEKALLEHARDAEVAEEEATPFGTQSYPGRRGGEAS